VPPVPSVRPHHDLDLPALKAIARQSHGGTRFYRDDRLSRDACDALYEIWDREEYAASRDDGPGRPEIRFRYVTCEPAASGGGRIGLFAVAPLSGGRGLGAALLAGALGWFASHESTRSRSSLRTGPAAAARLRARWLRDPVRGALVSPLVRGQGEEVRVPFNRPFGYGGRVPLHPGGDRVREPVRRRHLHPALQEWLVRRRGAGKALLTHSCTAALEMCALLLDVVRRRSESCPASPSSDRHAFALRGATPVFVDVRPTASTSDEGLLEEAVTHGRKRSASSTMRASLARWTRYWPVTAKRGLAVVEDDAQGSMARYRGRPLGGIGTLGAISFHETKNLISGEGGALLVNDTRYASGRRPSGKRAPTGASSPVERSRSTRGSTWDRPSCRAR